MNALKYDDSVRDYLFGFNELNSRIGITGDALKTIIETQMTPEMYRAIHQRHGNDPEDEGTLLEAFEQA